MGQNMMGETRTSEGVVEDAGTITDRALRSIDDGLPVDSIRRRQQRVVLIPVVTGCLSK